MHPGTTARERAETFDRLYRDEGRRLWRAVLAFAADPDVASDAVAEAFAQCLRRGEAVRDPRAWVWRAAFRIAAGELKERRAHDGRLVEEAYEMPDAVGALVSALGELTPRQRSVLLLFHYGGYRSREIARMLGIGAPTVRVHLTRARRRVRELLEEP
jgi:RNA polymerase sigma-70 factor (ECF subfamily)